MSTYFVMLGAVGFVVALFGLSRRHPAPAGAAILIVWVVSKYFIFR